MFNPITKFKEKHYQLGYQDGNKNSFDVGFEQGFQQATKAGEKKLNELNDVYDQLLLKIEEEVKELKSQLETKQTKNNNYITYQQTQKSDLQLIDEYLLYFKSITEIMNLNFFESTLYRDSDSKQIEATIQLIDYFISSYDIKSIYPETHELLPLLRKAFEKIYENKLVIEDAEKLF